ncbi:MAG: hypothetical protein ACP5HJ_02960 [Candidatus Micrarchaeia archaeon]
MDDMIGLIGKKVVVRQKNNWLNFGFLKKITDKFIVLQYPDGREEIINLDTIISIKEDKKEKMEGGRNGK